MATQYDKIGKRYRGMKDVPLYALNEPSIAKRIGNIEGLKCLDMACGLGDWSHWLSDRGAKRVIGVDISETMIKSAKEASSHQSSDKISFQVGDCSKPLSIPEGPFDLIFAAWLLNYASDRSTMLQMFLNIHDNLKPGGRFLTMNPNTFTGMQEPMDDRYGVFARAIENIPDGWKCRITAYVEPQPVEFDTYHFMNEFYERAAAEAGMVDVRWFAPVLPDGDNREDGFWDAYFLRPHMCIMTARRPE